MGALALPSEQAQQLDRPAAGAAEPVRHVSVELGGLPGAQDEVLVAEQQPELAVQDVEPLVALVGLRLGTPAAVRDDQLVGLDAAGPPGKSIPASLPARQADLRNNHWTFA